MFNLGFTELVLIGVIALIFIGPEQLPGVARTVGRMLNELKRATSDLQSSVMNNVQESVRQRREESLPAEPAAAVEPDEPAPALPAGAAPVAAGKKEES